MWRCGVAEGAGERTPNVATGGERGFPKPRVPQQWHTQGRISPERSGLSAASSAQTGL